MRKISSWLTILSALVIASTGYSDDQTYSDACGPVNARNDNGVWQEFNQHNSISALAENSPTKEEAPLTRTRLAAAIAVRDGTVVRDISDFPGIVKIFTYEYIPTNTPGVESVLTGSCGGVLINPNYILTAAHCIETSDNDIEIVYGVVDVESQNAGRAYAQNVECMRNFEYLSSGLRNDIALINIEGNEFDDIRETFNALAGDNSENGIPEIGNVADIVVENPNSIRFNIAGWGFNDANQQVSQYLRQGLTAFDFYTVSNIFVQPATFNRRRTQICQGDSGGPVYWEDENGNRQVIGIVSSEIPTDGTGRSCQSANDASFVNVWNHRSWMERFPDWE